MSIGRKGREYITNKNNFVTGRRRVVRSIPFRLIPCKHCRLKVGCARESKGYLVCEFGIPCGKLKIIS